MPVAITKNKDGASNAISKYTYPPLSGSTSQTNLVGEELTNDVSRQSALSQEQSRSSEESSNWTKPEETDKSTSWKRDSDGSEIPTNRNQFHFSIYKWATKGLPFAMPLRGANKSRLNEKCKLQRCSCEGIAGELHPATPHDIDTPHSVVEWGWTNKMITSSSTQAFRVREEISAVTQEAHDTELKPPCSLLSENDDEQGIDEMTSKTGLKESKVKSTKKSYVVFDVNENIEDQDKKANNVGVDRANFQFPPAKSRDSLGKNRVKGRVKEFVKIFNQEVPGKPNFDLNDSQHQDSRQKERRKFRTEDATNEKMHKNNVYGKNISNASILVDECLEQSQQQHPDTTANNLKSTNVSSGRKDRSAPTTESTIGDTDMSFLLITELSQDEEREPQTSDNHEEIQVIDDKIQKWSKGKEGNIRSLLSTLQYVLWSGSGWKPMPLVDIVEGNAVKRAYQKALLCLHPDKLQQKGAASHEKYIAEKVFDILQEAWTHFNTLGAV
ncbi:J domain-containing protein required for chloroplast accumulation response [Salix suchowensis]|nr:J domain-containing protein required for chloroplast accumulation response [Salix suchowensis]